MTIAEQVSIRGDKKKVFEVIRNMQSFPSFMQYVKSIKIAKYSPTKYISDWHIIIDDVPVRWKEEDIINEDNLAVDFRMIKGDYLKYKGKWEILRDSRGVKVKITVDIDWGAPAFTNFEEVKRILLRKTRKAFKGMLVAIKRKIEHKVR